MSVLLDEIPVVVRGHVPASMTLTGVATKSRGVLPGPRIRIDNAIRAFQTRHGVMPSEVEIDGRVYGVAGCCASADCQNVVLASDAGAAIPLCDRCR
jgi:hypothetical protein